MWSWKYLELNENLIKNLIMNLGVDDYLIKLMFTVYSSFLFWIGFLFILIHALSLSFHALSHFPLNHCFLFLLFIKWDIFLDSLFVYHEDEILFLLHVLQFLHFCPMSFIKKIHCDIVCFCMIPPFLYIWILLLYFHISLNLNF